MAPMSCVTFPLKLSTLPSKIISRRCLVIGNQKVSVFGLLVNPLASPAICPPLIDILRKRSERSLRRGFFLRIRLLP